MKAKICPECGRHNEESAWHCADCGETLSIKTLVDFDLPRDENALADLSRYFKEEVRDLQETTVVGGTLLAGYNLTQPTDRPPYRFGFLILTSEQLIRVLYDSDLQKDDNPLGFILSALARTAMALGTGWLFWRRSRKLPKRSCVGSSKFTKYLAVRSPTYPLSEAEIASREVVFVPYLDIEDHSLAYIGSEAPFFNLVLKLRNDKNLMLSFILGTEAKRAAKIIAQRMPEFAS